AIAFSGDRARLELSRHRVGVVLKHDNSAERIQRIDSNQRAFQQAGRTGECAHSFLPPFLINGARRRAGSSEPDRSDCYALRRQRQVPMSEYASESSESLFQKRIEVGCFGKKFRWTKSLRLNRSRLLREFWLKPASTPGPWASRVAGSRLEANLIP